MAGILQGHPGQPVPDPHLAEGLVLQVLRYLDDPIPADHGGQVRGAAAGGGDDLPRQLGAEPFG